MPRTLWPSSDPQAGVAPNSSLVAEGSRVLKTEGGNLYRLWVVAGASAGFVMLFDATAAPADGTVSPKGCFPIAANGSIDEDYSTCPLVFKNGCVVVFSTTGPFTKTVSNTAYFAAQME